MGGAGNFLTYLLGGVADSAETLRKKNEAQAQLDQEEQRSVYKILLQSPDPKIQSLGLTGLLEPPKKSPFGKLKESPTYMQALDLVHRGQTGQPAPPDASTTPPNPDVAAPPPPPPVPMSAAMPDVPPLTGGGGKTGPPAPSPAASAAAPTGPVPAALPPPPPPPPTPVAASAVPQGPHPEKVVHDFLSGFRSPEEALQWVNSQERGQIFAKPELQPLKVALTNAIGSGGTMEDVKDQLLPNRARFAAGAAKTHWQGKPIPAEAIPPGALDMGGSPLLVEKGKTYLPTLLPGDTTPRFSLAAPAPGKAGKVVYDTVGNKKVAKLVDATTGETIKSNLSSQDVALGHVAVNNADGSQTLVQFSNMPGGAGATSPPPGPSASSTTPPPDHPKGIELGTKPLAGQERTRAQAGNAALESSVQIQQMLKDPKVAEALGPLEGRKVTFEQIIGNIPPEMSKLKSALEGYALNTMGVHGMRSAQEAHRLISDALPTKFNAASLVSSLEGLNEVPLSWASKLPPPPREQRVVGRTVMVIKAGPDAGKVGVWNGEGWVPWTP